MPVVAAGGVSRYPYYVLLESFAIRGFRAFPELVFPQLGRANLLIGRNGVGKTTVLEALRLYARGGSWADITEIMGAREEWQQSPEQREETQELGSRLLNFESLFYGRRSVQDISGSIQLGPVGSASEEMVLDVVWLEESIDDEGEPVRRVVSHTDADSGNAEPGLRITFNGRAQVRSVFRRRTVYPTRLVPLQPPATPVAFVPAEGFPGQRLGQLWDAIALTDLEDKITAALRLIEPDLQRLSFIADSRGSRTALARLSGSSTPVPLKALGDGISRLLGIMLSLAAAPGGLLLVDEIENGVYYEVQRELWDVIFSLAGSLDTQVVATTHSLDTIRAFSEAARRHADVGYMFRIDRIGEDIRAVQFDEADMEVISTQALEVR